MVVSLLSRYMLTQRQLLTIRFDTREIALQANGGHDTVPLPDGFAKLALLGGSWGFVRVRV